MGQSQIHKPSVEASGAQAATPGSAGWRGQLQRSLQGEGFDAAKARLAPQAMPAPVLGETVEQDAAPEKAQAARVPGARSAKKPRTT